MTGVQTCALPILLAETPTARTAQRTMTKIMLPIITVFLDLKLIFLSIIRPPHPDPRPRHPHLLQYFHCFHGKLNQQKYPVLLPAYDS